MYESRLQDPFIDKLFEALKLLENEEEYYRFFEDICTVAELKAIAQRLEVAKMLEDLYRYCCSNWSQYSDYQPRQKMFELWSRWL